MIKDKIFQKIINVSKILILTVFIFNLLVAVFLFFVVPNQANAEEKTEKEGVSYEEWLASAQASEEENRKKGMVRVEVPIPGLVADTVPFPVLTLDKNGELKTVTKNRYYVDSLPEYITKIYSLSIGVLAMVAVIMIMISGLKWIFAGGNAYSIDNAKKGITGAVSALVLALCSYMILYFISPRLVVVSFDISSIDKIDLNTKSTCSSYPEWFNEADKDRFLFCSPGFYSVYKTNPEKAWSSFTCIDPGGKFLCAKKYEVLIRKSNNSVVEYKTSGENICYGDWCDGEVNECALEYGVSFCADPIKHCNNWNEEDCDSVNNVFLFDNIGSCSFRRDKFNWGLGLSTDWLNPDECVWGDRLFCPSGYERVSCFSSPEDVCWTKNKKGERLPMSFDLKGKNIKEKIGNTIGSGNYRMCSDSEYANSNANFICCHKTDNDTFELLNADFGSIKASVISSCKDIKRCDDYSSIDILLKDPCNIGGCSSDDYSGGSY